MRSVAVALLVLLGAVGVARPQESQVPDRQIRWCSLGQNRAGALLDPRPAGALDILQISTGRGNAAFFVFPDGTTLLVDAGAAGDGIPYTDIVPNDSRSPAGWIAHWIETLTPPGELARLDYALLTHFHSDHMGAAAPASPLDPTSTYRMSGITEVGTLLPIDRLIDRGWPDYSVVTPDAEDPTFANYQAFIRRQAASAGLRAEAIRVGAADQIVMRRDQSRYPGFEVRSVAGNGLIWTGVGDEVVNRFPPAGSVRPEDAPTENMSSIGLRVTYGAFDYFTGGDMPGIPSAGAPDWHAMEPIVGAAIGETDVHVVNHHGSIDPASPEFLLALRSQAIILPSWSPTHPSQDALKRMMEPRLYDGRRDIFALRLAEPTAISIGARVTRLASARGHVLVRVLPGGDEFMIFQIADTVEEPCVTGYWVYSSNLQ